MQIPQIFFLIIAILLVVFIIISIVRFKYNRNYRSLIFKLIILILLLGFSWIWFIPMYVGQRSELAVCKFRFQVFEYDTHDYGYGNWNDHFFRMIPHKYGSIVFHSKIGGWKEYFGLKKFEYKTYKEYFGEEKDWYW